MSGRIKLVQGDTRPFIRIILRDGDGTPINVTGATVVFKFREHGMLETLFTTPCILPTGGGDGQAVLVFPEGSLDVPPGHYEGEIEIQYGMGDVQTVYDLMKFTVREQFS
jgi:hypothetical protein